MLKPYGTWINAVPQKPTWFGCLIAKEQNLGGDSTNQNSQDIDFDELTVR